MCFKHKVAAVLAAGAITATMALPAMALENEFHGMYRVKGFISNFNNGSPGAFYEPAGKDSKAPTNSYVEQRARLKYIAKANDDLKLVTHFEIDSRWGDASYGVARNKGGALGADEVNLETKSIYLDFNIPATPINMKVGMQPWEDAYNGIFVDADMAGVLASSRINNTSLALGWFRFDDKGSIVGKEARDLLILDGKYQVNKDMVLGGSYYLLNDDVGGTNAIRAITKEIAHTLGVNAAADLGIASVEGFLLYQFGNLEGPGTQRHLNAFAGSVAARAKVGPGSIKTSFLYASGEKSASGSTSNAFQAVEDIDSGAEHDYESEMRMLRKDKFAGTTDNAIVYTINNKDQGVIFGSIGYDVAITDKLFADAYAGFAAVAKENANKPTNLNTGVKNSSNYLGTEINAEIGYKLFDNLTARLQGGYIFLGDYFKGVAKNGADPDNPYTTRIMMVYAF